MVLFDIKQMKNYSSRNHSETFIPPSLPMLSRPLNSPLTYCLDGRCSMLMDGYRLKAEGGDKEW